MARAIWKGVLRPGGLEVPVKLYSAVQDRSVHFRLLHARNHEPVKQRMIDPQSGKPVAKEDIRRGYEVEPGVFVLLDEAELAALAPEPSRDITVQSVVPRGAIPHAWFDRAYYLGPDGDEVDYFALARALDGRREAAVVTWVMRKQDYAGTVLPHEGHLMLVTLRHVGEVIPASALPKPAGRKPDEREVRMAQQLITALEDELDMSAFHDQYRERVEALIAAKASGRTLPLERPREVKPAEKSLASLLQASIAKTKEKKVA